MNKKVISIVAIIALVAILSVCLIACNADTYAKRLEKAGYTVEVATQEDMEVLATNFKDLGVQLEIKWAVGGTKGSDNVTVIAFATEEQATAYANMINLTSQISKMKAETKGKILIAGSEQGIKDAK
jgi:hypothetical protein